MTFSAFKPVDEVGSGAILTFYIQDPDRKRGCRWECKWCIQDALRSGTGFKRHLLEQDVSRLVEFCLNNGIPIALITIQGAQPFLHGYSWRMTKHVLSVASRYHIPTALVCSSDITPTKMSWIERNCSQLPTIGVSIDADPINNERRGRGATQAAIDSLYAATAPSGMEDKVLVLTTAFKRRRDWAKGVLTQTIPSDLVPKLSVRFSPQIVMRRGTGTFNFSRDELLDFMDDIGSTAETVGVSASWDVAFDPLRVSDAAPIDLALKRIEAGQNELVRYGPDQTIAFAGGVLDTGGEQKFAVHHIGKESLIVKSPTGEPMAFAA